MCVCAEHTAAAGFGSSDCLIVNGDNNRSANKPDCRSQTVYLLRCGNVTQSGCACVAFMISLPLYETGKIYCRNLL